MQKQPSAGIEKSVTLKIMPVIICLFMLAYTPSFAADLIKLNLDDVSSLGLTIESDSQIKGKNRTALRSI